MNDINCSNCMIMDFKESLCDKCDAMKRRGRAEELENLIINVPRWIPCAERKPTRNDHKDGVVLACNDNGQIRFNACMDGRWVVEEPIAWMPLPEPYEEEQDEQGAG